MIGKNAALRFELRIANNGADNLSMELWQLPCPALPELQKPFRLAGLHGRTMALSEFFILRKLKNAGFRIAPLPNTIQRIEPDEELALYLGLIFRTLAPMRNAERMRQILQGIDAMNKEESGYWLGMAMHRKNPRRVLSALRILLTDSSF